MTIRGGFLSFHLAPLVLLRRLERAKQGCRLQALYLAEMNFDCFYLHVY